MPGTQHLCPFCVQLQVSPGGLATGAMVGFAVGDAVGDGGEGALVGLGVTGAGHAFPSS